MTAAAPKTVLTGCLAPIDRNGLEQLIVNGKANPKVIKTLKCKTVAEGKFRHANYIRNLPPYIVDEPPGLLGDDTAPNPSEASLGYLESLLPMVVGSVDRLEEMPERVAFVFGWQAARAADLVTAEPDGARAIGAFAAEVANRGPLDRDAFRAAAARVREVTGLKGRALFHPIRAALTAADSGPELDLAVPAIDRGARLGPAFGLAPVLSCAARARRVAELTGAGHR